LLKKVLCSTLTVITVQAAETLTVGRNVRLVYVTCNYLVGTEEGSQGQANKCMDPSGTGKNCRITARNAALSGIFFGNDAACCGARSM